MEPTGRNGNHLRLPVVKLGLARLPVSALLEEDGETRGEAARGEATREAARGEPEASGEAIAASGTSAAVSPNAARNAACTSRIERTHALP